MADVFISYKKEDRALAEMIDAALSALQISVWWDKELKGGQQFRREIKDQLDSAGAVVVIWSPRSVLSDFVCAEANAAKKAGKLVPVMFDNSVEPPFPFGEIQSQSLEGWSGDHRDPRIASLVSQIDAARSGRVGAAVAQVGSAVVDAVARRSRESRAALGLMRSFQFVAFFGLPVYRLFAGAAVLGLFLTALWVVPGILEGADFGAWPIVFVIAAVAVLSARAMYQIAMILSGKYSRQFFDGPFSFWTFFSLIAAVVIAAVNIPRDDLSVGVILLSAPIYFCGVIAALMGLRLAGAVLGKLLART